MTDCSLNYIFMKIPSSNLGRTRCTLEIVSDIQNNFCTKHVLPMFYKKKSFWQRFACIGVYYHDIIWIGPLEDFSWTKDTTQIQLDFKIPSSAHSELKHDLYQSAQSSKCCVRPYSGESVKNKLNQQNMSTMRPKNGQIFSREVGIFWQIGKWRVKELAFTLPTNLPKKYPNVFKIKT